MLRTCVLLPALVVISPASGQVPTPVRIEVHEHRATFDSRVSGLRIVDFDDVDTESADLVAFASGRYRARGILIHGQQGQYASRSFGWPKNFKPASGRNMYAPGPAAASNAGANDCGHETTVTFVDEAGRSAAVAAFGCTFIDCNFPNLGPSAIEIFDRDGVSLGKRSGFTTSAGGHLSIGFVVIDARENLVPGIFKVKLTNGSGWPAVASAEGVTLDDFVFASPKPGVAVSPLTTVPKTQGGPQQLQAEPPLEQWNWSMQQPQSAVEPVRDKLHLPTPPPQNGEFALLRLPSGGGIKKALMAPDGRSVAAATSDGRVAWWSLASGDAQFLPTGGRQAGINERRFLAYTSDSKTLLANVDNLLLAWNLETRRLSAMISQTLPFIWRGQCSDDGRLVVVEEGDDPNRMTRWSVLEVPNGSRRLTVEMPAKGPKWAQVSGDGRTFAVALIEGMRLFDVASGQERPGFRGLHWQSSTWPRISQDGSFIAMENTPDHSILVWDARVTDATPRLVRRLQTNGNRWVLSPDLRSLLIHSIDDTKLIDLNDGLRRAIPRTDDILQFSADGRTAVAGRTVLNVPTGRTLSSVADIRADASVSADGSAICWVNETGVTVRLLKANGGPERSLLTSLKSINLGRPDGARIPHWQRPESLIWSPDGRFLSVIGNRCGSVIDTENGRELGLFRCIGAGGFLDNRNYKVGDQHAGRITLPDGRLVGSGTPSNDGSFVHRLVPVPGGNRIVATIIAGDKSRTMVTTPDLKSMTLLSDQFIERLAVSPDGKLFALVNRVDASVRLFDSASTKEILTTASRAEQGIGFAERGSILTTWDRQTIYFHDLATGQPRNSLPLQAGHASPVLSAAVHPTKPWFATGGRSSDLLVKDSTTGTVLQRMDFGAAEVAALNFSPDGKRLAACLRMQANQEGFALCLLSVRE